MALKSLQAVKEIIRFMTKGPGFDASMKQLEVLSAGQGKISCEMTVTEDHQNRGGSLHGGMTATLVDAVSTAGLMTVAGAPGVSVDINVSYINAARVGEEILIESETLKVGKTLAFLKVDIKRKSDGKLVATGRHTKHLGS